MKCPRCKKSQTRRRNTKLKFAREGYRITVEHVPAQACPSCGEQFIHGPIAEYVERIVDDIARHLHRPPRSVAAMGVQLKQVAVAV